jgi:hypothetical protein
LGLVRHVSEARLVLLPTGAGEARDLPAGSDFLRVPYAIFFPDGQRILFNAQDKRGMPRPYIQDLEGGLPKPFRDEGVWAVLISPDGQRVICEESDGRYMIYRVDGVGRPRPVEGTAVCLSSRRTSCGRRVRAPEACAGTVARLVTCASVSLGPSLSQSR